MGIDGMVVRPLTFTYADLLQFTLVELPCTVACIGNRPGGTMIANAVWTGVPLSLVFGEVGVSNRARYARFEGADGYVTGLPLAYLEQAIIAYQMNGQPLPLEHGYPARLIVPGFYGYKMPKWITKVILSDQPVEGFWEARGWSADGKVQTTAAILAPRNLERLHGAVMLNGYAYAGERAITSVEVSIDGADWMPVEVQRRSRYEWAFWQTLWTPFAAGDYLIKVRATDDTGYTQPDELSDNAYPDGARGLHGVVVRVEAV